MYRTRCLSTKLWQWMIVKRLFCFSIVVVFCTWHTEASNTTSILPCLCNSTTNSSSITSLQNTCNCTQVYSANCTKGYYQLNNSCVPCNCDRTSPPNCNCTSKNQSLTILCQAGYFLSSGKCENCGCNLDTSLGNKCNNNSGQCSCKPNVTGRQCNKCMANYTAIYSAVKRLQNCSQCAKGYALIRKPIHPFYECLKQNSTVSTVSTKTLSSSTIVSSPVLLPTRKLSSTKTPSNVPVSNSLEVEALSSVMSTTSLPSTGVPIPPILTTKVPTIHSPTSTPSTTKTSSLTTIPIIPQSSTSSSTITQKSTMQPKVTTTTSSSSSTTIHTTISPSTSKPLSPPPSSSPIPPTTEVPPTTAVPPPISTGQTTTKKPPPTKQPTQETEPTWGTTYLTSDQSTSQMTSIQHEESSNGVVTIVLVSIGVFLVLGIALGAGCWYLRSTRKPSAPLWTVELSNRNDDIDFALLDPVTDQPHSQSEEMQEMESFKPLGNTRYCAYI